jgi:hypothetical protein
MATIERVSQKLGSISSKVPNLPNIVLALLGESSGLYGALALLHKNS